MSTQLYGTPIAQKKHDVIFIIIKLSFIERLNKRLLHKSA